MLAHKSRRSIPSLSVFIVNCRTHRNDSQPARICISADLQYANEIFELYQSRCCPFFLNADRRHYPRKKEPPNFEARFADTGKSSNFSQQDQDVYNRRGDSSRPFKSVLCQGYFTRLFSAPHLLSLCHKVGCAAFST